MSGEISTSPNHSFSQPSNIIIYFSRALLNQVHKHPCSLLAGSIKPHHAPVFSSHLYSQLLLKRVLLAVWRVKQLCPRNGTRRHPHIMCMMPSFQVTRLRYTPQCFAREEIIIKTWSQGLKAHLRYLIPTASDVLNNQPVLEMSACGIYGLSWLNVFSLSYKSACLA